MTSSAANFHALHERLRLTGTLMTRTALRIGSGGAGELDAADLPVLRDADGFPVIPGGSLKGVLRSTIESLVRAAEDKARGIWACDPLLDRGNGEQRACGAHDSNDRARAQREVQGHCALCRLFGSRILASHARISDAPVRIREEDRAAGRVPVEVRDGVAIDRDLRRVRGGLKYDFEVVSPGTAFDLEIFVDNPEDWLLGLLAIGLDQLRDGFSAIGGFTSRGLGRVTIEWSELKSVTAVDLLKGSAGTLRHGPDVATAMESWRRALAQKIHGGA